MTRRLATYAMHAQFDDLPEATVQAAVQRLVDAIGCAIAAYGCPQATIGARLAHGAVPNRFIGRMLGSRQRTTAEAAAFVNTALIRNLDFNDQYVGGHPSDCLGALLALAEAADADGRRLLSSMVVAYELFLRLSDATGLRERGWDQGFAAGVSTAAGIGNLLRLPRNAIAEAIAITAVANVPMRNTRAGALSLWKGAATAYATRNGVFGALLAAEGMAGPERPFEGRHGLWDLITGPFDLEALPSEGGPFRTPEVRLKYWPVAYSAQLSIWAALALRDRVGWQELADIEVGTYGFAVSELAIDPEKWDPQTRETADHSLPYIFARTLVDGRLSVQSFEESDYRDPSLRPLMAKVHVHRDEATDAVYPATEVIKVKASTVDGRQHTVELRDPVGHVNKPFQDEDVRAKFLRLAVPVLGSDRSRAALEKWWELRQARNLTGLLDVLEQDGARE